MACCKRSRTRSDCTSTPKAIEAKITKKIQLREQARALARAGLAAAGRVASNQVAPDQ